jgi:LAGLIDADG-like domain
LRVALRGLGVLGDKHIPSTYLRASLKQRLALLQGLMDTDGTVDPTRAKCEFTTTNPRLATGVVELVRSLGMKPTCSEGTAKLYGRLIGPKWRIGFAARADVPPARVQRKAERAAKATRTLRRFVVSVEPIYSVPVRCIQVDSPSRLYLAGESMVATHNSTIATALGLLIGTGQVDIPGVSLAKPKGPILYLDFEWDEEPHGRRYRSLCRGMGLGDPPPTGVFHYHKMLRPFLDEVESIGQYVDEHGIVCVFFDSLWGATGNAPLEDPATVGPFMSALRTLQTTTLLLSHVSKAFAINGEKGSARGARAWRDACRAAWQLESTENREQGVLECTLWRDKMNEGPRNQPPLRWQITYVDNLPFAFESWDGQSVELPDGDEEEKTTNRYLILRHLGRHPQSTTNEIGIGTGLKVGVVRVELHRARKAGQVVQHDTLPGGKGERWSIHE